jgi:hypothetical protein
MTSSPPAILTGLFWFSFQSVVTTGLAQIPVTLARAAAVGGPAAVLVGVDGARQNPAALSIEDRASLSFGFSRPFGLSELDGRSVDIVIPARVGVFNIALSGFGYEAFSTTEFSVGFGRRIWASSVGLRSRVVLTRLAAYGSDNRVALDVGWMQSLTNDLMLGGSIKNVGFNSGRVEISSGLAMRGAGHFLALVSTTISTGNSADFRFGVEVKPVDALAVRLGKYTNPATATAGLGMMVKRLTIDFAISLHPRLGLTNVFTIRFVR